MTDDLGRLRNAFHAQRPGPRQGAREAALAAALAAFDAKKAEGAQGSAFAARLRIAAHAAADILTGRTPMRSTHALAGGASLAVITLAAITAANLQHLPRWPAPSEMAGRPQPRPVTGAERGNTRSEPAAKTAAPAPARDAVAERIDAAEPPAQVAPVEPDSLPPPAPETRSLAPTDQPAAAPAVPAFESRQRMAEVAMVEPAPGEAASSIYSDQGRDRFEPIEANPLKVTAAEPVSTFSIDVDTASYAFTRASLANGVLPPKDAVRVEELVNYFPYDYPAPETREEPFRASLSVAATPWNPKTRLISIGIKGFAIAAAERPRANLVFLLDTSGSMEEPNKLPLLVNSMKLLVDILGDRDTVSIVTYAGSAGTVLEPTPASEKATIVAALETLAAGGSTSGAEGIRQAYQLARRNFDAGSVNRVILATDGDFNVGITDPEELKSFVERERETGVFLSVLGFGRGNYNDELMQTLAQNGNGVAAYVDTLGEARKVLVEEAGSTMFPIAKDVKIQVEFNPATVSEYRLIGYETRLLAREDFNNDRIDAGEIGSGHSVTALYEVTPAGSDAELVDGLRYGPAADAATPEAAGAAGEYGFLKIRYKLPGEDVSRLIETPIAAGAQAGPDAAREARFAAAVAAFGQILRGGDYTGSFGYDDVVALANASKGEDPFGYRAEFVNLVRLAETAASMERQRP